MIGHTGITWGYKPENAEQAIKDVGSLGYYGMKTLESIWSLGRPKADWAASGASQSAADIRLLQCQPHGFHQEERRG